MIVNNIKTQLFYFHSLTQSLSQSEILALSVQEISIILNIFYVYDSIELKFSMIVNNIKKQLFHFHSLTQSLSQSEILALSVQEISCILNIFYVYDPIKLKFFMINNIIKTLFFYFWPMTSKVILGLKRSQNCSI